MSKMGQELERKLDENKYEMYEALKDTQRRLRQERRFEEVRYHDSLYTRVNKVIAKIEGKEYRPRTCARCSTTRDDDINSDICGSCADDLRADIEAETLGRADEAPERTF